MLLVPLVVLLGELISTAVAAGTYVDLGYSKYVGTSGNGSITQWLGMRFAAPPVGHLRFSPPEDPPYNGSIQEADAYRDTCLETSADPTVAGHSEDCLFINVFAPANASALSRMPVFFFIQGGGFNSLANQQLDGRGLIAASGYSIIVVTFNYRVGPYGFITDGDKITPNNGLLDQRKALEWVQEHIAKFGGNPGHVVLGGDSAGAASISLQMAAYGGRETNLFQAAAAESVSFATVLTVEEAQYLFVDFAISLGCAGDDPLACMRSRSAEELQTANTNLPPYPGATSSPLYPWNPVIDGGLVSDLTYNSYAQGKFVRIPVIFGDDTNGGTIFTPQDTSNIGQSDAFLHDQFPYLTLAQLGVINALYPNPNHTCPNVGCYWRQVSDAYGDMRYMCPTLYISSAVARHSGSGGGVGGGARAYTYRYNVMDPTQVAEGYGVPHTVELSAVFGPENMGLATPPASYFPGGVNAPVVPVVQAYWTSFIRTFDPNTHRHGASARWEVWDPRAQDRLLFDTGGVTRMELVDQVQRGQCEYFYSIGPAVRQ
ncbi:alpha/beta-hydrolase [Xylariaceae sp. FL0804]|nr:alpha/beta-hydrolase [Xylariaceae sp. FL0804]